MDWIREAQEVLATCSVTFEGTRPLAEFLAQTVLSQLDLEFSLQEGDNPRDVNLLAWKPGKKNLPALLLTSHLDTVPPGDPTLWTKTAGNPFSATREGDRLYGLGSADAKLDWLAKAEAVSRFCGTPFLRPLLFAGTYGEERGLVGARQLLARPPFPLGFVFAGEPTELKLVHAHKGLTVWRLYLKAPETHACPGQGQTLRVLGRSAHSATPGLGENALRKALQRLEAFPHLIPLSLHGGDTVNKVPAECELRVLDLQGPPQETLTPLHPNMVAFLRAFLEGLEELPRAFSEARPEFSPPTLTWNPAVLHAEGREATLLFDVRPLPGQGTEALGLWLQGLLRRLLASYPSLHATLKLQRSNPPLWTPLDSEIVRGALQALARVGLPLETGTKAGCTEAGLYGEAGVSALVFGAGKAGGNIHAPNEWVSLSQLQKSADFYAALIETFCCSDSFPHP